MILFVVDAGRDETYIHRVDWENGKFLGTKTVKGSIHTQAIEIFWMMRKDRCSKIAFERTGIGLGVEDQIRWFAFQPDSAMILDNKGNVKHLSTNSNLDGDIL